MAVLPTDYTNATTPTGATTELPATTSRGLNAITTQINTNTTDIAARATLTGAETLTNKTLTTPKIGTIWDGNGNEILILTPTASAVNEFTMYNNVTGQPVTLAATGNDTNIDMIFQPKGTGWFGFHANAGTNMGMYLVGSQTNIDFTMKPKGTGWLGVDANTNTSTGVFAVGTQSNIDFNVNPKGTGVVKANNVEVATISGTQTLTNKTLTSPKVSGIFDTNGGPAIGIGATASAANYFNLNNATAGNAPRIYVDGSDTNINLAIEGKGTGIVSARDSGGTYREVATISGTQTLTNKTLTDPKIGNVIRDANGNNSVWVGAVASAVNYVQINNNSATNPPAIMAVGTDTNVNLELFGKGTGIVKVNSVEVATISATQTLSNKTIDGASNTVIRTSGVVTPVRAVADGASLTYTISAGNVTQINGTTLDGVTMAVGDRVLVLGAPAASGVGAGTTTQPGNGVYTVTNATTNLTLSRAADFSGTLLPWGIGIPVREGSNWGGQIGVYLRASGGASGAVTWGTTAVGLDGYINGINSGNTASTSGTQTLTNKRITPRVASVSNTTSWTINSDTTDFAENTGLTGAVTINNPTGTPTQGQRLWVTLTGTASRAISYGTAFEDSTVVRPTTTSGTAALDIGFRWNSVTSKWRCVAYA